MEAPEARIKRSARSEHRAESCAAGLAPFQYYRQVRTSDRIRSEILKRCATSDADKISKPSWKWPETGITLDPGADAQTGKLPVIIRASKAGVLNPSFRTAAEVFSFDAKGVRTEFGRIVKQYGTPAQLTAIRPET